MDKLKMLKVGLWGLCGILLLVGGCVTTSFKYTIKEEPVYAQEIENQGLVYLFRKSIRASGMPIEVYMDDKPVGVSEGGTYFYFYAPKGIHNIRAQAGGNVGQLNVTIETKKVYYIKQDFTFMGVISLEVAKPDEGQASIKNLKYVETQLP
ncbi:MAG: hypothetical protein FD156_1583 [Nitrospirae bacterium]|nr:MAG: hypothetical protein FD156_1583 [Nitrospirota bacterium]